MIRKGSFKKAFLRQYLGNEDCPYCHFELAAERVRSCVPHRYVKIGPAGFEPATS
jgi:hypothetical protein